MPDHVLIGSRKVGEGQPVFIIAEAGSNHNREYAQALALIDVAAEAGADAVKFQSFSADRLYPRSAGRCQYLNSPLSIYAVVEDISMPDEWIPELAAYCARKGIEFMSTVFDERSAALVDPYVRVHKIASYELTHTPLIRTVARFGKPVIVSTGASELEEVQQAIQVIEGEGNDQIVVCQCTAKYPAPLYALNLRAIPFLRDATRRPVGLSDHSREALVAPVAAVAVGACLIEKHFTLRNDLPGPDHRFAVEPDELRLLVNAIRSTEQALGRNEKRVQPVEQELRTFARRSIFTTRKISKGDRLTSQCIAVLRCGELGFGLAPEQYDSILGRAATRDLPAETLISLADVE